MSSLLQPEFFTLVGIDLFLAMSLLTCLLDKHFPWPLPYIYQLAALVGFGQLLINREFMVIFGDYTRFWNSLMYLLVALANIIAVNMYLGLTKKLLNHAKAFMGAVTFPALLLAVFFIYNYSEAAAHPIVTIPQMSLEAAVGIVISSTLMVGLAAYVFSKSKWQHITLGAGVAISSALAYVLWGGAAFAMACVLVIGVGAYTTRRILDVKNKGGENSK
jgi:hypothetical protein